MKTKIICGDEKTIDLIKNYEVVMEFKIHETVYVNGKTYIKFWIARVKC
ncbi:MAG: hypothetical protein RBT49_04070 [Bacteroidales bacterium]|jgi:hypothetical protein|nr:hypothetical protein [Bacteroidales bacterium]